MNSTFMFVVCVLAAVAVAQADVIAEEAGEQFFFESADDFNTPRLLVGGYYNYTLTVSFAETFDSGQLCSTYYNSATSTTQMNNILTKVAKGTEDALVSQGLKGYNVPANSFSATITCTDGARRAYVTSNFVASSSKITSAFTASAANAAVATLAGTTAFRTLVGSNVASGIAALGSTCYATAASPTQVACNAGTLTKLVGTAGSSAVTAFMSMTMMAVVGYFMLL